MTRGNEKVSQKRHCAVTVHSRVTLLIDTKDACLGLNASRPIAKGDLKWRDALLVAHRVNSNIVQNQSRFLYNKRRTESSARPEFHYRLM